MYKIIIPGLVSVETDLKEINGFHICQDLDFFPAVDSKCLLHYKIALKNNIKIPTDYDFRDGYFIKKGNYWYYQRKFIFSLFKFQYDCIKRTFYFNQLYAWLPFRIGGIFLVGEHLASIIYLELFLHGYTALRGIAVQINNKVQCFSAPGFNGKTTLLLKLLKNKAKYIAEDHLIINFNQNTVYPSCPFLKKNFWQARNVDTELKTIINTTPLLQNCLTVSNLYFLQNYSNRDCKIREKKFIDFLELNSLYFFYNPFAKSYIFDNKQASKVFQRISELETANVKFKQLKLNVKNFT